MLSLRMSAGGPQSRRGERLLRTWHTQGGARSRHVRSLMADRHVCTAQFMIPCGDCYTDCDDEGYSTPDANTIDGKCGYGFTRVQATAPAEEMER